MLFDRLGIGWNTFKERVGSMRALVVDDEPVIRELLETLLADEGFEVQAAATGETAFKLLSASPFDLVVTDKNLPGMSGLDLIAATRKAGIQTPAVLITGYASLESVSEALQLGASDYITKPFDDINQVVQRLKSVAGQHLAERFYARIIGDLKKSMLESADQASVQELARELSAFTRSIDRRLPALVVGNHGLVESPFLGSDIRMEMEPDLQRALGRALREDGPLVVIIGLDDRESAELFSDLKAKDPLLEMLVIIRRPSLASSLTAIAMGAAELLGANEGNDALINRVNRLIRTARRQRLHVYLIAALYRRLQQINHPTAEMLAKVLPQEQRMYLNDWVPPDDALPVMDIQDLFPDLPGNTPFNFDAEEVINPLAALAEVAAPPPQREATQPASAAGSGLGALLSDPTRLRHIGRLLDLGQHAAELVHEARQPLSNVRSVAQLALQQAATQPAMQHQLQAILDNTARLETLIERVAAYSRGDSPELVLSPVDVNTHVVHALSLLARRRPPGVSIYRDLADDLPKVMAEPLGLEQVILNLVDNALGAVGQSGRILIRSMRESDDVVVLVEDNGPGIPPHLRDRIFEPFVSEKPGGTGLGLHICRTIVHSFSGRLELLDVPHGASFGVRLPAGP